MKRIMRLLGVLLIAALMMSMGVVALGTDDNPATGTNTITVTNTIPGETYKLYKLMDLVVDDPANPTTFRYTVAAGWNTFFTEGYGKDYVTIDAADGHVSWKEGKSTEDEMILFAQEAGKAATNPADTKVAAGTTVEFTARENGYYLVTSSLGTRAMLDSTPTNPAQTIAEKNAGDTITKQVQESSDAWGASNDAQIGETVNFRSSITIQPYTRNVYIHDAMDAGLDYNNNAAIEGLTEGTDYVILETPQGNDTFTVRITDTYISDLDSAASLTLTYSAKLNEKAVVTGVPGDSTEGTASTTVGIVPQKNTTRISYGDSQSITSETVTTTHKFSVYKHASGKSDNLPGAIFQVKKAGEVVKLVRIRDTDYRVANATEAAGAVKTYNTETPSIADGDLLTDFITVASGDIVIWGVDADNDYTLNEVKAPDGYNKLSEEKTVAVAAADTTKVDVENNSGTELPGTGGVGTTVFYAVGGILVLFAGVLLIVRKRMSR